MVVPRGSNALNNDLIGLLISFKKIKSQVLGIYRVAI
ncbi:hypothetical protein T09_14916 [Trichinella sp. T9]|nr:hypothetical protein T09_14916 [Trichinella sp. T9]